MIFIIQRGDIWAMFKEFEIEFESYTNYQHDSWIKWEIICGKFYIDTKDYSIYEYFISIF
jgi:hypothetical protein